MEEILISIKAAERGEVQLRDTVNFLWDFNLLYEISRLALDPKYRDFRITPHVFQRNGRPLWPEDRLRLIELSAQSPLKLRIALAAVPVAAATLWTVVQTAQTISNWPLQREKLEAEVLKTQLEVEKLHRELRPHILIEDRKQLAAKTEKEGAVRVPKKIVRGRRPRSEIAKINRRLRMREAQHEIEAVTKRLERSPVKIEDVAIEIVSEDEETRR